MKVNDLLQNYFWSIQFFIQNLNVMNNLLLLLLMIVSDQYHLSGQCHTVHDVRLYESSHLRN